MTDKTSLGLLERERSVAQALRKQFPARAICDVVEDGGAVWVEVQRDIILNIMRYLRDDEELQFALFVDITCVDYLKYRRHTGPRFAVVYTLYSFVVDAYVRVKVRLDEGDEKLSSITSVFGGAGWAEREVFDLYGISFDGHPDLRRILMPSDYSGHPLRKDYPLRGRGERDAFPVVTREES